jgi:hypothetical protein
MMLKRFVQRAEADYATFARAENSEPIFGYHVAKVIVSCIS